MPSQISVGEKKLLKVKLSPSSNNSRMKSWGDPLRVRFPRNLALLQVGVA